MVKTISLLAVMTMGVGALPASGTQFDRLATLAGSAKERNNLEEAANLYRQALKLNPAWKEGWWSLGAILYDRSQYPEACDGLRRFVNLAPKAGGGVALLGLCDFQMKQYEEALAHLDRARTLGVANGPLASASLFHFGLLMTRFEQYEAGGQIVLGFALAGQTSPSIVEAAGLAGLRMPLLPSEIPAVDAEMIGLAGRAMCAAVARKPVEARQVFARLVKAYPDKPNVHYLNGSFLLPTDPEAAFAEFESELRLNPDHVPALVAVAMEDLKRGDSAKALPLAEKAVRVDPQAAAGHAALGKVLTETGDFERAVQELQTAAKLAPDSPQIRIALASAYTKAGRSKDAARERAEFLRLRKLSEAAESK